MTTSTRWLIALGWSLPLLVALVVSGAPHSFGSGPAVVLLVAPVVPLSLVLFGLGWLAGRRQVASGAVLGRADRTLLHAAMLGVVGCLALAVATLLMYVA